jgi:hypothetical protein
MFKHFLDCDFHNHMIDKLLRIHIYSMFTFMVVSVYHNGTLVMIPFQN